MQCECGSKPHHLRYTDNSTGMRYFRVRCNCGNETILHLSAEGAEYEFETKRSKRAIVTRTFYLSKRIAELIASGAKESRVNQSEYVSNAIDEYCGD